MRAQKTIGQSIKTTCLCVHYIELAPLSLLEECNTLGTENHLSMSIKQKEYCKIYKYRHENDDLYVYMDFLYPSSWFGVLNFRSIESVLTLYPNAKIRVLMIAPERSLHYKYANFIPRTLFDRYVKRGYDVDFDLINERVNNVPSGYGNKFFKRDIQPFMKEVFQVPKFFKRIEGKKND